MHDVMSESIRENLWNSQLRAVASFYCKVWVLQGSCLDIQQDKGCSLAVPCLSAFQTCKMQTTRWSRCSKATSWQPDKPSSRNGHKPSNKVYHVFRREERNQRDSLVVKQWKCEERLSDLSWSDWSAINSVFIWLRKVFQLQVCCAGTTQDLQGEGGHQTWQRILLPWMNCF